MAAVSLSGTAIFEVEIENEEGDIDPQCSLAIEQSKNWKSFFLLLKIESFHVYRGNNGNLESYIICYLNDCYDNS